LKDLLVHEAHRHPFLERLAQMYLLKLRHREFVSNAGAVWRQLAVMALFPWLMKHRVFDKERREEAVEGLRREHIAQMDFEEQRGIGFRRFTVIDPAMIRRFVTAPAADYSPDAATPPAPPQRHQHHRIEMFRRRRPSAARSEHSASPGIEQFAECQSEEFAECQTA